MNSRVFKLQTLCSYYIGSKKLSTGVFTLLFFYMQKFFTPEGNKKETFGSKKS